MDSPDVELINPKKRIWKLKEYWVSRIILNGEVIYVCIPTGFLFDRASIPRFIWPIVAPDDLGTEAPMVHDFLYRRHGTPALGEVYPIGKVFARSEIDKAFLYLMERDPNITAWKKPSAYWGVRAFGWWPFLRSRARQAQAAQENP